MTAAPGGPHFRDGVLIRDHTQARLGGAAEPGSEQAPGGDTAAPAPSACPGQTAHHPCLAGVTHDITMDIVTPPSWACPCAASSPVQPPASPLTCPQLCPVGEEGPAHAQADPEGGD